ncbi:MAG TPA: response regulator [Caldithrix abyssi]|uniref:Response regulator n=1 Tax=Caldithrix abyssi TaxID=187145 RepID=A0A7V4UDR0_CALAY|nr:response regulator [Caldithrix abyssi]
MDRPTVLVVDNERSVRQALRFELEDEGFRVIYATDFNEALSALRAFDFDIVITDVYLNKGDGIQLINKVKSKRTRIPFILISAFPDSDLARRARHLFKDRFYEKPFFMPALKQKVYELLDTQG